MNLSFHGLELARTLLHQLSWSTLLGVQVFESFIVVKVAYRHLPPRHFAELQKHLFRAYFRLQVGLTLLTLVTAPSEALLSFNSKDVWFTTVPLLFTLLGSVPNYMAYGPLTESLMMEKAGVTHENSDGMRGAAEERDKKPLARRFSFAHSVSIHLNAIALVGTVWHGLSFVL